MHRGCFLPAAALVAAALVPVVARGSQQHVLDVRVSVGNDAGNGAFAARALALSADGVSAAFSTSEPLVASDVDGLEDLYLRSGGQTYLLTPGAALGGAPEFEPGSVRGLPDGRVLFGSHNDISDPMPDDATVDYFVASSAGVVTLLTAGSSNDAKDPAVSPGGAYFAYSVGNDTYRVPTAGGMPEVVTVSGATGTPVAVSDTGAVLVATTDSGGGDTDTATDLRRFAAPSVMGTLVTPGTSNTPVTYLGGSADLGVVAFATLEGLPDTNADANGATDAYEIAGAAAGGALRRLSRPGAGVVGVSGAPGVESAPCVAGGGDAILVSTDRLAAGDADSIADVYRVPVTGDPVLLSGGDSSGPAVPFATADCSRLVVSTMTPLAAGSNGTPAQYVITGTTAALAGNSSTFFGATPDGASVLINSDTRLTAEDENSVSDAYVFTGGVRRLVTRGGPLSAGETGAAASADGGVVLVTTTDKFDGDTDAVDDVYRYKLVDVVATPTVTASPTTTPAVIPTATATRSPAPTVTATVIATPTPHGGKDLAIVVQGKPRLTKRFVARLAARAECPAGGGDCTMTVKGSGRKGKRKVGFGSATLTVPAGTNKPAKLRLSLAARERLSKLGPVRATFRIRLTREPSETVKKRVRARIRPPR